MALADPQTVPGAVPVVLNRVSSTLGNFGSSDLTHDLNVSHSRTSGRIRHVVKLSQRKIATDPLLPSTNRQYTQSVHIVIDTPLQGFAQVDTVALGAKFVAYLATAGLLDAVVQGQS